MLHRLLMCSHPDVNMLKLLLRCNWLLGVFSQFQTVL